MRSSSLLNFAWLAGALLASGCTVITSLDGWTFGDEDPGQTDGGAMDASQADAGPACTADLTDCSGECIDLDSSSEHCGACMNACPTPPNTVALCTAGTCGWECAAGFADCNGEPADGCEIDTANDPLHCGACESSCVNDLASLSCREGTCRPRLLWARAFRGTGTAVVTGVALDSEGNIYVSGHFDEFINLGGADLVHLGSGDVFVASYTATGEHRWSRSGGGPSWDSPNAIAFDESVAPPRVHVAGSFQGTATFDDSTTLTSQNGSSDIFIVSFDAGDGSHIGSRSWGGPGRDEAKGLTADSTGSIYVTGLFSGERIDFGGRDFNLSSAGDTDIFVASYPWNYAMGADARWAIRFGSTGPDEGRGIALDGSTNVLVSGSFSGSLSIAGHPLDGPGEFIASFSSTRLVRWARKIGDGDIYAEAIAADPGGNIYVAGNFSGSANFGGAVLESMGDHADVFLASYSGGHDAGGTHRWSRRAGGSDYDEALGIAVDHNGSVYSTGTFYLDGDFGGGTFMNEGNAAFVTVHEGGGGGHRASFAIGGPDSYAWGAALAAREGRFCIGGRFSGRVRVGDQTLMGVGDYDAFIACFEP